MVQTLRFFYIKKTVDEHYIIRHFSFCAKADASRKSGSASRPPYPRQERDATDTANLTAS